LLSRFVALCRALSRFVALCRALVFFVPIVQTIVSRLKHPKFDAMTNIMQRLSDFRKIQNGSELVLPVFLAENINFLEALGDSGYHLVSVSCLQIF